MKENACDMFIPLGWAVDMPYRDLNAVRGKLALFSLIKLCELTSSGLDKHNKFTVAEVDQWLDLQYTNDPENSTTQIVSAKKPDPQHGVYTYMDTTLKLI